MNYMAQMIVQNTPAGSTPPAAAPAAGAAAPQTAAPVPAPPQFAAQQGAPGATTATVKQAAGPEQPQGPSGVAAFFASPIFLLILMFVVFYFLLIRPQQKKQKEHQKLLQNLKKGDEVVTASGIFGKIAGLTDTVATIEIADKVRVKILRSQIAGLASGAPAPQDAKAPVAPVAERK